MKYKVVLLVLMVASSSWTEPIVCEEEESCGGPRKEEEVPLLVQDDAGEVNVPLDVCVLPNDFAGKATLVEDCETLDKYRAPPKLLNYRVRVNSTFIFFFSRLPFFAASIDYCPSMRCHLCCECCCFYTFLLLLLLILLVLLLLILTILPLCLFSQASSVLVCCPSTDHDHEIFFPGELGPALSGEYIDEALAAGDGGRREEPYNGDEDGNVML